LTNWTKCCASMQPKGEIVTPSVSRLRNARRAEYR
jgi:hypothetical protein